MTPNVLIIVATGFIPLVLSMLWYSPALFGNTWLNEMGMTKEDMKKNQKPLKFILSLVVNILLGFGLFTMSAHEFSVLGLVGGDPALATSGTAGAFLAEYGGSFSRFSHGAVHAIFAAILVALPFLAHQAMWSGKSFKAFAIDFCFWLLAMVLMGGVISQWGGNLLV